VNPIATLPLRAAGRPGAEELTLAVLLAAMALIPLAEIALRAASAGGVPGGAVLVQHLTLICSMAGAAIAARQGRLLSLASFAALLPASLRPCLHAFAACSGGLVALFLAVAGAQLVLAERAASQAAIAGLPAWWFQAALPLGFVIVAGRLVLGGASTWPARLACAAACGLVVAALTLLPLPPGALRVPGLILLAISAIAGAPIFAVLGGAAVLLFWGSDLPIAALAVDHYRLTVNPSLPAIPLFTLAGYFLAESRAPQRLVRVFDALFSGMRGGAAVVTVAVSALFTAFTGASGVTILALGALLMPLLLARHPQSSALGIVTSAGSLGVLVPPSLPLILYAVVAHIEIEQLFLAALVPAAAMSLLLVLYAARENGGSARRPADWGAVRRSIAEAKWELLVPLVALGALFSGLATPVEAAAVTAVYAFVVTVLVHRELHVVRDVPRVMAECGLLVGGILLILGVALGFTNYLVDAQIPDMLTEWATGNIASRLTFLLALNLFLLGVGCLMDIFSAIVVVVPLIAPIAAAFGIDPLHLGVIFLANMELGYLTPPVGLNLFFSAYRFEKPVMQICRSVLPYFLVMLAAVLLVTYVPQMSTWLPGLLG
jgi:tripartite ATP-independent transporter DctM subunit